MFLLLLLVSLPIFTSIQENPKISWIGHVTAVQPQMIHASSGPQGTLTNLTITLASGAHVWKKTMRADFSAIHVGDQISVRGYRVAVGEVVATEVWGNYTRVFGRITDVRGNQFDILLYGDRKTILVDDKTVTDPNRPFSMRDVQKGRDAEVIGVTMSDGTIDAVRVIVSVNGRPVGMPPDAKIRDPRGRPAWK